MLLSGQRLQQIQVSRVTYSCAYSNVETIEIFGWIFFVAIPAASLFFLIALSPCYREVSRYFSMILYFSMWLYIIFEIPAEICGLWYNSDLEIFRIPVYYMIPGIWLILFIEHYFCTEYEYLTNLGDVSDSANIVRNLRLSQPQITFHVNTLLYHLLAGLWISKL